MTLERSQKGTLREDPHSPDGWETGAGQTQGWQSSTLTGWEERWGLKVRDWSWAPGRGRCLPWGDEQKSIEDEIRHYGQWENPHNSGRVGWGCSKGGSHDQL